MYLRGHTSSLHRTERCVTLHLLISIILAIDYSYPSSSHLPPSALWSPAVIPIALRFLSSENAWVLSSTQGRSSQKAGVIPSIACPFLIAHAPLYFFLFPEIPGPRQNVNNASLNQCSACPVMPPIISGRYLW